MLTIKGHIMFEIEKNIEIPASKSKYPFDKMMVGDSFLAVGETGNGLSNSAHHFGKLHSMKFKTMRTEGDIRVWRIK